MVITFDEGYWFDEKNMLEQAKLMWKEMGDEVRQDFGEDYFEYKIRSMPEHNVSQVSKVFNPLKEYL